MSKTMAARVGFIALGAAGVLAIYIQARYFDVTNIYPNGKSGGPMNSVQHGNKRVFCPSPFTPLQINGNLPEECFDQEQVQELIAQALKR